MLTVKWLVRVMRSLPIGVALAFLFSLLAPLLGFAVGSWSLYQHDARHSGQSDFNGPNSPAILWVVPFGTSGKPTTPIMVSGSGKAYVGVEVSPMKKPTTTTSTGQAAEKGGGHSGIFAFGPNTKVLWVSKVNGKVSGPPAIGRDGTVYAAIGTELVALKDKDGSAKWKVPLNGESVSGVTVGADGTVYTATSDGATVYVVSGNGKQRWMYTAGAPISNPLAVGGDGTVYFTTKDLSLYAVGSNGSLKWQFTVTEKSTDQLSGPVLGQDGTIYIGGNRNNGYLTKDDEKQIGREYLYAISPSGQLMWRFQAKGKTVNTPAIAKDGTIIFSTTSINYTVDRNYTLGDCFVQAVNPDGSQKWYYHSDDNAIDGPALIGSNGLIYVSSTEGQMTCLSRQGIMIWRAKIGGKASIGPKDILYVAAKSSIAAIVDRNSKELAKRHKRVEEAADNGSSPTASLSYLIYILPVIIALGIGYFFKTRVGVKEERED